HTNNPSGINEIRNPTKRRCFKGMSLIGIRIIHAIYYWEAKPKG
ncbi:MAG: hypothetical protein ACJAT7_001811, partial [Psychromonas sp.]